MPEPLPRVFDWIDDHESEMVEFLTEYVRHRSITEAEEDVHREFIEPYFASNMQWDDVTIVDVSARSDRPNINARLVGEGEGRNILFNGHSDVAPVTDTEADSYWTHDPWDVTATDDVLYGRGVSDMKGPNTAVIWAARALMESDVDLGGDVMLSLVVGEERCQQDVGSIPATNAWLEQGIEVPFCINAEPTNNEIHVKSASLFNVEIDIRGKSVHASQNNLIRYPQRAGVPSGRDVGVDANMILMDVLARLYELQHRWNREYSDDIWGTGGRPQADVQGSGAITMVPTIIESGSYIASISNRAHIEGQVYIPPSVSPRDVQDTMRATLDGIATTHEWLEDEPIEVTFGDQLAEHREFSYWPAFDVSPDHPGCEMLGEAVERTTGQSPVYSGFKAVTDGGFIQNVCGVDTVSFGPGNTHMGVHGADEYVPKSQLLTAAKVYAACILDWCRNESPSGE